MLIIKSSIRKALTSLSLISNNKHYGLRKTYLLGSIYVNLKKYDKAIVNILKNGYLKIQLPIVVKERECTIILLYVTMHKKNFQKAKFYFDKELSLIKEKDTLSVIRAKMDLANVYYSEYLDKEAIPLFKEAYDLAKIYSNIRA